MSKKRSTATRRTEAQAAQERAAAVRAEQERGERRRRSIIVTLVGLGVLVLVVGIGYAVQSARDTSGEAATSPSGVVAGGYAVPAGRDDAPVKVQVYEDFMCPFCGDFEAAARDRLADDVEAGRVQLQYHPLSFLDDASSTEYSTRAANALAVVLDAAGPEAAVRFHDLLFADQPEEGSAGLSDDRLVELAVQAGATEAEVRPGIEDRAFEQWVENVGERASQDGVSSTPTVVVDGERVNFKSVDELVGKVEDAVEQGQ